MTETTCIIRYHTCCLEFCTLVIVVQASMHFHIAGMFEKFALTKRVITSFLNHA